MKISVILNIFLYNDKCNLLETETIYIDLVGVQCTLYGFYFTNQNNFSRMYFISDFLLATYLEMFKKLEGRQSIISQAETAGPQFSRLGNGHFLPIFLERKLDKLHNWCQ